MASTLKSRFWAKVKKTRTCWLWTAYLNIDGYGQIRVGPRMVAAHRVALEFVLGRKIKKGKKALHNCKWRRKSCVRHVYEGTHRQNMLDRKADGTYRGENHPFAKLTEVQAREILAFKKFGKRGIRRKLSEKYQVSIETINGIWSRRKWKHI